MARCPMCGGPEVWTMYKGEKYVACERDCEPSLPGFNPSLNVKRGEEFSAEHWEPSEEGGVVPLESGDASPSAVLETSQQESPAGFLEVLWEGSDHAET